MTGDGSTGQDRGMTRAHARTLAALAATPLLLQACGSSEPTMTDATEGGSPMIGGSTTAPTTGAADVSGTTGVASTTTGGGETTFLCGDTRTCELAYQYCLIETGPDSTSYYCEAMPSECIENRWSKNSCSRRLRSRSLGMSGDHATRRRCRGMAGRAAAGVRASGGDLVCA